MRCQTEYECHFYTGNQFTRKWLTERPLLKINLPNPPPVGTYMVFEHREDYFRVHQVCLIDNGGSFVAHVFLDPFPGN